MSLVQYRKKRHFARTAEPKGKSRVERKSRVQQGLRFVVQKHAASHLHYDFRLELGGTLKSWAVPKGPCLDPAQKRLAIQVEDHPLEYGNFEGTIPAGEYGGGTVMVWDRGTWSPEGDPEAAYRAGRLKFTLKGEKLNGEWALVRTAQRGSRAPQWLLIKHRDAAARPLAKGEILDTLPASAATGRTLDEIAAGVPPHRNGQRRSGKRPTPRRHHRAVRQNGAPQTPPDNDLHRSPARHGLRATGRGRELAKLSGAKRGPMPKQPRAELAVLVPDPPKGPDWLHEIKFDGYRMFCCVEKQAARFISRNGQDWTGRLGTLAQSAATLPAERVVLDGEVVVLDAKGVSQFQLLQNALSNQKKNEHSAPLFYTFDLLYLDGFDLTGVPLETRKSLLQAFVEAGVSPHIRFSEHIVGTGAEFRHQACRAQLEGIVSKRRNSLYQPGRGTDWRKCKCRQAEEFVIGGYTRPAGSRIGFGALLLGYFRPDGQLAYAGRVGTGFDTRLLRDLGRRLKGLEQAQRPFAEPPSAARAALRARGVRWVRPELVAQIEFSNWTDAGVLRQASYQGLREDKPAREVVLEVPINVAN